MTMMLDKLTAPSSALLTSLVQHGWVRHGAVGDDTESVIGELGRVGEILGTRVKGRAGALEEVIQPQALHKAHPRSLSAQFGLKALPFHVELSHRPRPCRYLLLGCLDPGSPGA